MIHVFIGTGKRRYFGVVLAQGLGRSLGEVIYGGWWVGTQMGWWGGINTGSHTVYQLIEDGSVRYIGQTNNFPIRAATWLKTRRWNITPIKGLQSLSKFDARAIEQTLIELYKLENLYNKYYRIRPGNPIYFYAIMRGTEILNKIGYVKIE